MTFDGWNKVGPVLIPLNRQFVNGLAEKQIVGIVNENAEWTEGLDEQAFVVPGIEKEPESKDADVSAEAKEKSEDDATEGDGAEDDTEESAKDGAEQKETEVETESKAEPDSGKEESGKGAGK